MGWLAPGFLLGLLGVALPVWLHLLRRSASTPRPFSSLMLFEPQQRSTTRRRRIAHWALLLLRVLLIALLAAAFAEPWLRAPVTVGTPERLLVLVVDDSFSMRAGTRMADAQRAALAVLNARGREDRAQVVALSGTARILTQPLRDGTALASAVTGIRAGDGRGSFAALATVVRAITADVREPVEVHLFSDMQRTGMPADFRELALPAGASLVLHPVGGAFANWTVESVVAPAQLWNPAGAQVSATIAGFGTPAATRQVSLLVEGREVARQRVSVPASGRATVSFAGFEVPHGLARCAVRIDGGDALPADDEYDFVIERGERARGLFVHHATDSASWLYFHDALTAAADAAVTLDETGPQQLRTRDLAPYAFVVVSDVAGLPAAAQARLTAWVRGGGQLLLVAGTTTAQQDRVPVFDAALHGARNWSGDAQRFTTVADVDAAYPPAGRVADWDGVQFRYAVRVDESGSRVALRLADGTPLLLEKTLGAGRALLFTSGFDNLTSDLPLHPVFVAFVDRLAAYLTRHGSRTGAREVDDLVDLRPGGQAGSVDVVAPDGSRPLSIGQAATVREWRLTDAGFYQLRLADGSRDVVAVNTSRLESDLEPVPQETLKLWQAGSGNVTGEKTGKEHVAAAGAGGDAGERSLHSLWWYAMVLALVAFLTESILASRYLALRESS